MLEKEAITQSVPIPHALRTVQIIPDSDLCINW